MSRVLIGNWDPDASILMPEQRPGDARQDAVRWGPNLTVLKGTLVGRKTSDNLMYPYSSVPSVPEIQVLTPGGTISGGTWTVTGTRGGISSTTTALAYNASAATIQAALEALANVGVGKVVVTGGPISTGSVTLTWQVAEDVPQVTVGTGSLTGSSPTLTPSTTQAGTTAVTGIEAALAVNMYSLKTDANSLVFYGGTTTPSTDNVANNTSPVWTSGVFDPTKLVGLDTAARRDLRVKSLPNGFIEIPG